MSNKGELRQLLLRAITERKVVWYFECEMPECLANHHLHYSLVLLAWLFPFLTIDKFFDNNASSLRKFFFVQIILFSLQQSEAGYILSKRTVIEASSLHAVRGFVGYIVMHHIRMISVCQYFRKLNSSQSRYLL